MSITCLMRTQHITSILYLHFVDLRGLVCVMCMCMFVCGLSYRNGVNERQRASTCTKIKKICLQLRVRANNGRNKNNTESAHVVQQWMYWCDAFSLSPSSCVHFIRSTYSLQPTYVTHYTRSVMYHNVGFIMSPMWRMCSSYVRYETFSHHK